MAMWSFICGSAIIIIVNLKWTVLEVVFFETFETSNVYIVLSTSSTFYVIKSRKKKIHLDTSFPGK